MGTIALKYGNTIKKTSLTTPDPVEIQAALAEIYEMAKVHDIMADVSDNLKDNLHTRFKKHPQVDLNYLSIFMYIY